MDPESNARPSIRGYRSDMSASSTQQIAIPRPTSGSASRSSRILALGLIVAGSIATGSALAGPPGVPTTEREPANEARKTETENRDGVAIIDLRRAPSAARPILETREALLWSVHELARTRTRSHEIFGQIHDLADVGENAMSSNRSTMVEQEGDRYVAEAQGFMHALGATFGVILATEIGDKTFFIAAVLVMRHSRLVVWSGAVGALAVMTILSAVVGHAAPLLLPPSLTHYAAVLLFFIFGTRPRNSGAIPAQFWFNSAQFF